MKVLFPASFICNCRQQIVPDRFSDSWRAYIFLGSKANWHFQVLLHNSAFISLLLTFFTFPPPPAPGPQHHHISTAFPPPHFYCFYLPHLYGYCTAVVGFSSCSCRTLTNIGPIIVEQWRGFYS